MTQVKGNNALKGDAKPVLQLTEGTKKTESAHAPATEGVEKAPELSAIKIPTVEELKHRATVIHLLSEKHSKLISKRQSLDKFELTHDKDNAEITVTDATGEEFRSNSPKSISQLIEFWKAEFQIAIDEIEIQLKKHFES